jgi:hypothetical protein
MRRSIARTAFPVVILAVALAAVGCGGAPAGQPVSATPVASGPANASVIPVIVSSQQVVGPNRFVFSFLDPETNLPAAAPDRTAAVALIAPGATEPGPATPAEFTWAIEGSRGVYVANVDFQAAGDWRAVFLTEAPGKPQEAIGVGFQVQETGTTIPVGATAPASDTPTGDDVAWDLAKLSTDAAPDPAFYQLSVADALAGGRPFVLVFATPSFCQTAQCGPTLDKVKAVSKSAPPSVAFINVEPYRLEMTEGRLQPVLDANGQLQPVPAVSEWGLLSEPWVFTVGADGIIRGSFEGVLSEAELTQAIADIAGS